jgi:hypothetical protein
MITAHKKKHSLELQQFGPIIFLLGAMSFFYHQSNFYLSQVMDFLGMFFFVGWIKGMNLIRLGKLKHQHLLFFNILIGCLSLATLHVMYLLNLKFQILIVFSIIFIVASEFLAQRKHRTDISWLMISMAIFFIAFCFSLMDVQRLWCNPSKHGWLAQGHALWHWIGSIGALTLYKYYTQVMYSSKN